MTKAETTHFCARIVGPIMLVIGAAVLTRFDDMAMLVPAVLQDGPLAFITGIFTLICGIVLLAAHHHWSSAPAVVITLLGFFTALRGAALLFAPTVLGGITAQILNAGPASILGGVIATLIGAWLTVVGWFTKAA